MTLVRLHDARNIHFQCMLTDVNLYNIAGPAILRSRQPLQVDEWVQITADRQGQYGTLVVNNGDPVNGKYIFLYSVMNNNIYIMHVIFKNTTIFIKVFNKEFTKATTH